MSAPSPSVSWVIGSAPDCDIVAVEPVVSGKHCRLSIHNGQYVLEDLGSTNGTFVNGHRLDANKPVYVTAKDTITLGRTLPLPWPRTPEARPSSHSAPAPSAAITIGRNPESDIQLDYGVVSWDHARILQEGGGWVIEDRNSTNGTALNRVENKIRRAPLRPEDEIYLGSYKIPAAKILTRKHLTEGQSPFERVNFQGSQMVLGRDPGSDYPLDYPMISWRHAMLRRAPEGVYVEDLGSRNGTFIDGARITGKTLVAPGQEIGLGSFRFQLLADGGLARREYTGNVTIEVSAVSVNAPNGDRLLDPVSLTIFPSELVALMGPAGAGKTTFLKAMNGYTPPAGGRVLFNGDDLYRFYDRFRQQMSYVPQDDIVHAQLTVREALYFSARLRTDLTDAEIEVRIDKVLTSLGILDKKNTIIGSPERKVLSGGQRKRVNIAMELINDTPVIFLDEPTSGLSSYDADGVISLLKKLSTEGKTIVTTIHQPSLDIFKQFDDLIMISRDRGGRGALAYFGPAHPDAIEFFDPEGTRAARKQPGKDLNPEMLLSGLAKRPTPEWAATYEGSNYKRLFVAERSGKVPSTPSTSAVSAVRKFGFQQWWTLVRRNFILKIRDRMQTAILLIQAPVFAILVGAVFGHLREPVGPPGPLWQKFDGQILGVEFLMVVAAIWFGCNNVARDIVGEWTAYQRERMVSLKLPSYVFSKVAVAGVLSLVQCLLLLGIVAVVCHLKGNFLQSLAVLYLTSMVGAAIGLLISAKTETTEAAIAMLPLVLLPMVALGGGIKPITELKQPVTAIVNIIPSRWALETNYLEEAGKRHDAPENASALSDSDFPMPSMTTGHFGPKKEDQHRPQTIFAVLFSMLAVFLAGVLGSLRSRDIQ